ncbi:hypothetical protein CHH72_09595 [Shouchella clausii]|uniref:Uncharacterized protein n=1 Tax=Shouchella clausii TaxID=79880 RepID=A0A268P022_SHOCL|nr:hypothetical protein CHH72_09595 [Shouchella clausii]
MKDILSSAFLICGWLCMAISAYLLFWTVVTPLWAIIPFLVFISMGLLCFRISKKLNNRRK